MDDLETKAAAIVETLTPQAREEWLRYDASKDVVVGAVDTMTGAVMGILRQTGAEGPERAEAIEQIITKIISEATQVTEK